MVDVSRTVVAGEWSLIPHDGFIIVSDGTAGTIWTDQTARDLWQVLNAWIERNAKQEAE